jgi:hypothetical protein
MAASKNRKTIGETVQHCLERGIDLTLWSNKAFAWDIDGSELR